LPVCDTTNQAKLIGILYLENNLTPHVFTPDRVTVLKVLASPAAISLESTRLYRRDEKKNCEAPAETAGRDAFSSCSPAACRRGDTAGLRAQE